MVNKNVTSCMICCSLRSQCTNYYENKCRVINGIIKNLLNGKIKDLEAFERANKIFEENLVLPVEFQDCCLAKELEKK